MNCCQCQGIEAQFDRKKAAKKLETYRAHSPDLTTRILIDALKAEGAEGMTLLDIGGGVGAIQHELLRSGVRSVTNVEASTAYIAAARAEHERQGHADHVDHRHGNFVDLAADLPPADIVTLDRVICCYHDMQALVGLSAARARKLYGVVYPRDTWWAKIGLPVENFFHWLRKFLPFLFASHHGSRIPGAQQWPGATFLSKDARMASSDLCAVKANVVATLRMARRRALALNDGGESESWPRLEEGCLLVKQFVDEGLGNSSYLVGSEETGLAVTIDARYDFLSARTLSTRHRARE